MSNAAIDPMKPLELEGVSRETLERLQVYHGLLIKWQEKINLVSPATIPEAWERHFIDSAQLLPYLSPMPSTLYDLGCGAGFPGLVLAIMRPDLAVTLIESDAKKCAFLQTVSRETGVPVTIQNSRIEAATEKLLPPDFITARALASLTELLNYVRPWLEQRPDMRLIFPKGAQFQTEIDAAKEAGWAFDMIEKPSQTDKSARILLLSNLTR